MKKLLLFTGLALLSFTTARSQCVYTCSNYAVSAITFSTLPSGTLNVIPTFTNPYATSSAGNMDDGATGPIPIGFNFDFYCNTYTDVYICSNGFITFVPITWVGAYVHPPQNLPNSTNPNGMVAFNMTDLDPGVGGTVTYTTVGTSPYRMFIVTYSNVPCFGQTVLNTGQIVLHETTNIIEIHTKEANPCSNQGTLGGTQGIEDATGSIGVSPTVNATSTPPLTRNANANWHSSAGQTAYRFAPYSAPALTGLTGSTLICQNETGSFNVPSATGALGYNWSVPNTWTGTSTTTAATFTAVTSGTVYVSAEYTCGASPAAALAVTVIPAPVVSIVSVTPAITCSGKTVEITVSGGAQYTLDPGGMTGPGPTFVDMPLIPTQYTLVGADQNGCNTLNGANASVLVLETPTITVNSGSVCQGQPFTMAPSGLPAGSAPYVFSSVFATVTNTVPGMHTYTVTGTSTNGCVSDPAISTLTVNALPTVSLTSNRNGTLCTKESITLTASGTGATTFTWSNTSATTQSIVASPANSGFVYVSGFTPEGCVKSSSLFVQVSPCTGIEENNPGITFNVFPNPSNGSFQINSDKKEVVHIFDVLGREVHRQQISEGTSAVKLSFLAPGRYIIKGEDSGTTRSIVITNE